LHTVPKWLIWAKPLWATRPKELRDKELWELTGYVHSWDALVIEND